MTRLQIRLLASSRRLVPFLILVFVWLTLCLTGGGDPLVQTSQLYFAHVIFACASTILLGNIDDDGHRELLEASVGGRRSLHYRRAAASFLVSATLATGIPVVLFVLAGGIQRYSALIPAVLLSVAGSAVGCAVGSCLHRPLVNSTGLAVAIAGMLLTATVVNRPVLRMLDDFGNGRTAVVYPYASTFVLASLALVSSAGFAADTRR